MNKRKGLSLIETLISLTIVGVSLVALLPVLTIKQQSFSHTSGNDEFIKVNANSTTGIPEYYYTADRLVNIGVLDTQLNNHNLLVNTLGFAYQHVPSLYVTERLYFNTNKIYTTNNSLLLSSGNVDLPLPTDYDGNKVIYYPVNAYFNQSNVIIANATNNLKFVPKTTSDNQWTLNKTFIPWDNVIGGASSNPTNLSTSKIYSITNENTEYIHVSSNNPSTKGEPPLAAPFYHIGIGKNAITNYISTKNYIGIYNENSTNPPAQTGANYDFDLCIGMRPLANVYWQDPKSFVISHDSTNSRFNFNANVNMDTKSITTNSVTLASDRRLKTILGNYKRGLKEILKINPVAFTYKTDKEENVHIGVIAQNLRKIIPESVSVNKSNGYLLVSTDGIFYALLNSIKELNNKNEELKRQNDELEEKIKELRKIAGGQNE